MEPLNLDATSALLGALRRMPGRSSQFRFEEIRSRSWASATFTGARHELELVIEGEGAEGEAARLSEFMRDGEFALRGHIVADIAVTAREPLPDGGGPPAVRLRIEALTVEDR